VPGGLPDLNIVAYDGDSSWLGWPVISGHWYHRPGEADVNTQFLTQIGLQVGDQLTLIVRGRPVAARIVGQIYDPNGPSVYTSWQTLGGTAAGLRATGYAIELRPGTSRQAYLAALTQALRPGFGTHIPEVGKTAARNSSSLLRLLTELIAVLAGLGVLTSRAHAHPGTRPRPRHLQCPGHDPAAEGHSGYLLGHRPRHRGRRRRHPRRHLPARPHRAFHRHDHRQRRA
jgi:putative ABC transport system permease protein